MGLLHPPVYDSIGGRYAYLIGFMDDYSRFMVGADLFRSHTAENVLEVFRVAAGEYQPPSQPRAFDMKELVQQFLEELQIHNYSQRTILDYGYQLNLWQNYLPTRHGAVWRHTCATHLVQNHASLRHVQDLLGHRSLATTERYLRLKITDLKEAHAKFHPRQRE